MSWRALRDDDLVAVIAPAGPGEPEALAQVESLLARFGLRARLYPSCHACDGFLAGPDDLRLADLHAAFADPTIAAVWCLRGGYGSGRLLDRIDAGVLLANDKAFIGYSDITALHALRAGLGLVGLHAPMLASDLIRPGHEADAQALFAVLRGGLLRGHVFAPSLDSGGLHVAGSAEGPLIGGNLSLVASLVGTAFAWQAEGAVLFLEDVGEEPYRIDRLMAQLRLAGVLGAAAGFVLGHFSGADSPHAVLKDYLGTLGKPVQSGWPAGHGLPNLPLPLGARVRLDTDAGTITLLQDVIHPRS